MFEHTNSSKLVCRQDGEKRNVPVGGVSLGPCDGLSAARLDRVLSREEFLALVGAGLAAGLPFFWWRHHTRSYPGQQGTWRPLRDSRMVAVAEPQGTLLVTKGGQGVDADFALLVSAEVSQAQNVWNQQPGRLHFATPDDNSQAQNVWNQQEQFRQMQQRSLQIQNQLQQDAQMREQIRQMQQQLQQTQDRLQAAKCGRTSVKCNSGPSKFRVRRNAPFKSSSSRSKCRTSCSSLLKGRSSCAKCRTRCNVFLSRRSQFRGHRSTSRRSPFAPSDLPASDDHPTADGRSTADQHPTGTDLPTADDHSAATDLPTADDHSAVTGTQA